MEHFVYIWFRPNGIPCYVGKGKGARWRVFSRTHNPHLTAIIRLAGGELPAVIIRDGLSNEEAISIEVALIKAIGREVHGGPLVNLTDGGEGNVGWTPSPEMRARVSAAKKGVPRSAEHIEKSAAAQRGMKRSAEARARMAAAMKGVKRSAESCANIKLSAEEISSRPEVIEYRRANAIAQFADPEARRRASESVKALWSNPEYRAQQMATRRANIARKRALESVLFIQGF